jgi:hypothetical protein
MTFIPSITHQTRKCFVKICFEHWTMALLKIHQKGGRQRLIACKINVDVFPSLSIILAHGNIIFQFPFHPFHFIVRPHQEAAHLISLSLVLLTHSLDFKWNEFLSSVFLSLVTFPIVYCCLRPFLLLFLLLSIFNSQLFSCSLAWYVVLLHNYDMAPNKLIVCLVVQITTLSSSSF